jgi:hypothetical protein
MRSPLWASLAPPAALVYAGFSAYTAILAAYAFGRDGDEPGLLMMQLAVASPLGFIALALGILGHFNSQGRPRAASAVRITIITPGCVTALFLIVYVAIGDHYFRTMVTGLGVIAFNLLVVFLMRDR